MVGMLVGYARVSTDEQPLALQQDALEKAGCEWLVTSTRSNEGQKPHLRVLEQSEHGSHLLAANC